jgi:hypothetical protein
MIYRFRVIDILLFRLKFNVSYYVTRYNFCQYLTISYFFKSKKFNFLKCFYKWSTGWVSIVKYQNFYKKSFLKVFISDFKYKRSNGGIQFHKFKRLRMQQIYWMRFNSINSCDYKYKKIYCKGFISINSNFHLLLRQCANVQR